MKPVPLVSGSRMRVVLNNGCKKVPVDEPNKDLPIYLKRLPNGTPIHEDQYDEMLKLIEEHEGPIT